MIILFFRVMIVGIAIVLVYNIHLLIGWLSRSSDEIDPTIVAAIVAASATIIVSIYASTYNARKANELTAREANRAKKAEAYNGFLKILVQSIGNVKNKSRQSGALSKGLADTFLELTSTIMIYGGPKVVTTFGEWRQATEDPQKLIVLCDKLLREMRSDLGESNKGITDNDILSLFIVGGKDELNKVTTKEPKRRK